MKQWGFPNKRGKCQWETSKGKGSSVASRWLFPALHLYYAKLLLKLWFWTWLYEIPLAEKGKKKHRATNMWCSTAWACLMLLRCPCSAWSRTCPFPKDPQFQHSTDSSLHIAGELRLAQVKSKYCQEGLGVSTVGDNGLPSRTSASRLSLVCAGVSSVGLNSSCPRADRLSSMLSAGFSTFSF